jgi:hypothetical protein
MGGAVSKFKEDEMENQILKGHTYKMHDGKPGAVFSVPGEPYPYELKPGQPDPKECYGVTGWGAFTGYVGEKSFFHPIEEIEKAGIKPVNAQCL